VNRARVLRKKATHTERILWRHLQNRNFAGYKFLVSIPSSVIYRISIIRQQSSQLNWMAAGIAIVWVKFAIEKGRSCLLVGESLCGSGIIKFAVSSTVS